MNEFFKETGCIYPTIIDSMWIYTDKNLETLRKYYEKTGIGLSPRILKDYGSFFIQ